MEKLLKLFGRNLFFGIFTGVFIFLVLAGFFKDSINNYFIGDDFTWLKWASTSNVSTLVKNFYDSQGFFYRPIDKLLIFFVFKIFAYNPFGYHLISLFLHYVISLVIYLIFFHVFKKKSLAFIGALFFALSPVHEQNIFWFSTFSITLSSLFSLLSLAFYYLFKTKNKLYCFIVSIFLSLLAALSYEGATTTFLLIPLVDFLLSKNFKKNLKFYIPYFFVSVFYLILRTFSGSAGFSGDYNYNLIKLIPNFTGNFFGYLLIFLFGPNSVSFYSSVRESLKDYAILISFVGAFCLFFLFFIRNNIKKIFNNFKLELLGILFAFISLLPFLGLGNISDRYLYLPSFGLVGTMVAFLNRLVFLRLKKPLRFPAIFFTISIIIFWFYFMFKPIELHWSRASQITYKTVAYLRANYPFLPKNSNVYIVNVPIKYGDAYVFPVGLEDAVWSIYKDDSIKVYQVGFVNEAYGVYRLRFNSNFEIKKIDNEL